ncbi:MULTISPECIES: hypothetical protein [Streptomyces]|uniref:Uncharacterized protein n=1 Tax=Streptomyces yunnanensis TaxID=156453 RepID=A0ABY8A1L3_9ACTN|nr:MULTISPECIES: hypothetical protein [Streptomyces]AJC53572.1 hypothetical protein GZL_00968 [Streptomyces sp. 769]WEB38569.1 hypothetical protein MOV08_04145 [Streptomyces yunnanensis]
MQFAGVLTGSLRRNGLACAVADLVKGEGSAQDEQAVAVEGEAGIRDLTSPETGLEPPGLLRFSA